MTEIEQRTRYLFEYVRAVDTLRNSALARKVQEAVDKLGCDPLGIMDVIPSTSPDDDPLMVNGASAKTVVVDKRRGSKATGKAVAIVDGETVNLETHTLNGTPRKRARPKHRYTVDATGPRVLRALRDIPPDSQGLMAREVAIATKLPIGTVDNCLLTLEKRGEVKREWGRGLNPAHDRVISCNFWRATSSREQALQDQADRLVTTAK